MVTKRRETIMAYGSDHTDKNEVLYSITAEDIHNFLNDDKGEPDYSSELFDRFCDAFLRGKSGTCWYFNEHLSECLDIDYDNLTKE